MLWTTFWRFASQGFHWCSKQQMLGLKKMALNPFDVGMMAPLISIGTSASFSLIWLVILGEHCWDVMFDWGHVWRWKRSLREVPPVDFCTDIKLWEWSSSQCLIASCQNWCQFSARTFKEEPTFGKHEARCWLVDTSWNFKSLGFLSSCRDCDDRNSLQFIVFFEQRSIHSTVIRLNQARCSDGTQNLSARPRSLGGAVVGTTCYNQSILWKSEGRPYPESWRIRSFFVIFWHENMAGTPTNVLSPKELGWASFTGFISCLATLDRDFKWLQVWRRLLHVMSVSTIKEWLMLMMYDDSWWSTVDAGGSSKSNAGRWTTWLLTKTHHTDTSNPEVPSRKRRSGDLGKLSGEVIPLGSIGDKVWQNWEVFTRRRWGCRSYWLIWLALSCFFGIYIFCYDIVWYCIHFDDLHNSSCCGKWMQMSLTGWPPSIPQISGFNLRPTLCRHHIFHAFSATEKTRAESLRSLSA